jgi:amino acid adenylation domain-containing protein
MSKRENIHELFSRKAAEFPSHPAVVEANRQTTYHELETNSNRLANFLVAAGARSGSPVAVLANDRANVVTAIIGILKAGCVFVPLEPGFPEGRLKAMLSEVEPEWFVTEAALLETVGNITEGGGAPEIKVVTLDRTEAGSVRRAGLSHLRGYAEFSDETRPGVQSEPDAMCSIYFTSGSSGSPKGIAGRLRGIDHFARWEATTLGVGEGTRVSQLTSPAFDGFLKDVFVPLCAGGTVCVPESHDVILSGRALVDWTETQRINILHCVPSVFRVMLNEGLEGSLFGSLKYVVTAGEPLLPADIKRWMDVFGERIRLVNFYGPTETTIIKLFHFVEAADKERRTIPIGKPIDGTAALVIDARGKACPPGAMGEIYIRTPFRSLGYYGRPDLTAESFVPNPFTNDPNDIIYRTGDLGRVLEDGNFEFLGRKDQQVKVRGVRVELGEIESHLRKHEAVKDVSVIDREDTEGNKYLCSYVVLSRKTEMTELREYLSGLLPDFMVPSAFMQVDNLPRTFNGKIDRRALAELGHALMNARRSFDPPRDMVEETLAAIWSKVLNLPRVSIHDNFFELGGHSLLATKMLSRVRASFEVEIPLRALFEKPTVAGLAHVVGRELKSERGVQSPAIERVRRDGELPLTFAQQRLWFLDQLQPGNAALNLHASVRLDGPLNVAALRGSLDEVVKRHEVLRTTFSSTDGRPFQVVHPRLAPEVAEFDLGEPATARREAEAQRLMTEEGRRPFNLSEGPLLRASILRLGEQEHALLLTVHHIVCDGQSMNILVREMAQLYEAFVNGEAAPLGELEIQYADYAAWQRHALQGDAVRKNLIYWKEQLKGPLRGLHLTTDKPRPTAQTYQGATYRFELAKSLSESLERLSLQEGVTLYITMLAGFESLLYRYTGQDDIIIGSPLANRNRPETEGLIGLLLETLALRVDLSGNPTFRMLLGRVREATLGAYAHGDLPFDLLVERLRPTRHANYTPLFQVWFVLNHAAAQTQEVAGIKIEPLQIDRGGAQFDLALSFIASESGVTGHLDYDVLLFEAETIAELVKHLVIVLEAVAADPDQRLSDIPLGPQTGRWPVPQRTTLTEDQFVF